MGPKPSSATGLESQMEGLNLSNDIKETWTEYAPRPDFGKAGRPINLYANMFATSFNSPKGQAPSVYHYDVEINPVVKVANQKKPKPLLWAVWKQLCQEATGEVKIALDTATYDMVKNAYFSVKMPVADEEPHTMTVALREEGQDTDDDRRRFQVVFKLAFASDKKKYIDLDTINGFCQGKKQSLQQKDEMLTATQSVNVLLRDGANDKYKPFGAQGRRLFSLDNATTISSGGVVLEGFSQSFRCTNAGRPAIQLDTAYSAFVQPGSLPIVATQLLNLGGGGGGGRGRGGPPRGGGRGGAPMSGGAGGIEELNKLQIKRLNDVLRNAKFQVTHRKSEREFSIKAITTQPCADIRFTLNSRDGGADRNVTLAQYFKEQYNITIAKPRLPAVQFGAKNFIPMEFVKIVNFNSIPMRSLTPDQTSEMLKVAAKRPADRLKLIRLWRQKLDYEHLPKLKAWGLTVEQNPMELVGRVLPPPAIMYGGGKTLQAKNGAWNLMGVKFAKPNRLLKSWAVLSLDRNTGVDFLGPFITTKRQQFIPFCGLINKLVANGVAVENRKPPILHENPDTHGAYTGIGPALRLAARAAYMQQKVDPQLLIVIEPRRDTLFKATIKNSAFMDLQKPVVTSVLLALKINDPRRPLTGNPLDQYLSNVSMKIHAKLGGVTHMVNVAGIDANTMIIGADVTHPPPSRGAIAPSIAVAVSTTDGTQTRFLPTLRLQEGRKEIIQDLVDMVYTQIANFEKNTKTKPQKIFFARDGVSEGQYSLVVDAEVKAVRDAAAKFGKDYKPKITFIILAKRHHMRFFAVNETQDGDKTGNLPAGTVVDTKVCHPFAYDFFIQPHAGLQGTAKPTHCVVLLDEIGFAADRMQAIVNNMSYSYARATRAVSLFPAAYYADIIAGMARDIVYTDTESDGAPSESSGGGRVNMDFDPLKLKKLIEDNPTFNTVAWYM